MQPLIAKTHGFAVAGAIDDHAGNAARGQIGYAFEILNFFGHIEAVEKYHRGRRSFTSRHILGVDQYRRQRCAFVRDFNVLDFRAAYQLRGIAKTIHAALVGGKAIGLGLQKTFTNVVVVRGAKQILRAGGAPPGGNVCAAGVFDLACLARPLGKPGRVVTDFAFQAQADAIDLIDFGAAPRRGIQSDQHAVRPAIIFGEIHEREFVGFGDGNGRSRRCRRWDHEHPFSFVVAAGERA